MGKVIELDPSRREARRMLEEAEENGEVELARCLRATLSGTTPEEAMDALFREAQLIEIEQEIVLAAVRFAVAERVAKEVGLL